MTAKPRAADDAPAVLDGAMEGSGFAADAKDNEIFCRDGGVFDGGEERH